MTLTITSPFDETRNFVVGDSAQCLDKLTGMGGGLWMSDMGTPDLGTAGAGRVVLAADASTAGAAIDQEGGPLQGSLKGEYDSNAIILFAVNLIWKI